MGFFFNLEFRQPWEFKGYTEPVKKMTLVFLPYSLQSGGQQDIIIRLENQCHNVDRKDIAKLALEPDMLGTLCAVLFKNLKFYKLECMAY